MWHTKEPNMAYNTLLTDVHNGIMTVTINREDKMNALNSELFGELEQVVDEVYANPEIKGVVLTGAGSKAFAAGADISEFTVLNAEGARVLAERGQNVFFKIERCPKPWIAAVNGFALGGGCELAMACHMRIAGETARFGQPEVNLGIIPGYGGTQRMTQLIGKGRAFELLMTADMINAGEAYRIGLVNKLGHNENLVETAEEILEKIATKAPLAIAKVIEASNAAWDETKDGYAVEVDKFVECTETADFKEGAAAFLEKRRANFVGK